jgi:hypothetical protein
MRRELTTIIDNISDANGAVMVLSKRDQKSPFIQLLPDGRIWPLAMRCGMAFHLQDRLVDYPDGLPAIPDGLRDPR